MDQSKVREIVVHNNEEMLSQIKDLVSSSISSLKRSSGANSAEQMSEIKRPKTDAPESFNNKSNEDQYKATKCVLEAVEDASSALERKDLPKTKEYLEKGSANTRTSTPHTSTAGTSSPLVCNPSVSNPVSNPISEHRRVFNYASRGFAPLSRRQKGKKKISTCTLKFFCLGSKDDEKPPSTIVGKAALANCGLGPASITCDVNAMSIHEYLCERYPPLSAAGGYELLLFQRGGEDRGFCKLPTPYTPMKLKDIAGQAHIYIRPLQKNIYMENQDANIEQVESGPMIECFQCHEMVSMHEFRQHQEDKHGKRRKRPATENTIEDYLESESGDECKASEMIGSSSSPIPVDFMPGPSSALTDSEQLNQLVEMFPNSSEGDLRVALTTHGTVSRAALSLSNSMVDAIDGDSDSELGESVFLPKDTKTDQVPSLTSLLERLQKKMSNEKEKLKIDEEDLLNDALAFYKDSDFDASKKLRVIYNNQPAADTGGVTRQFFTQLLRQISDEFFEGDGYKRPIYNSQVVASGMMKLCGTIIVHSILQGGPGLPIFSPSVYYYLATGDSDAAIKRMTVNDCSLRVQSYINEVISAVDISTVNEEETMNILSECGLTMPLTNNNKVDVMKSIIVHDSIGKPKIVLDQLREGLHTLGFGDEMKKYPDIFQPLFVFAEADLKGMLVVDVLRFPECMNSDETNTRNFLTAYLSEAGQETLENFLVFTTGAPSLPNFGLGSIEVKFDEVPSIFASTCLQEVTFPRTFPDEATFTSALDAVVNTVAKSFNCV